MEEFKRISRDLVAKGAIIELGTHDRCVLLHMFTYPIDILEITYMA